MVGDLIPLIVAFGYQILSHVRRLTGFLPSIRLECFRPGSGDDVRFCGKRDVLGRRITIMIELALKALKLGSLGPGGRRGPANRVWLGQGFYVDHERVKICCGSTYRASLRLGHVTCLDSTQFPAPAKRKTKVEGSLEGPTKAELKLLKDLRDFTVSCNLPPNAVPTTAELARHGRKDLANRVRRKGYKQVEQLLEQVHIADTGEHTRSEGDIVPPRTSVASNVTGNDDVELSSVKEENIVVADEEEPSDVGSSPHGALQELPLSAGSLSKHSYLNGHASLSEILIGEASGAEVVPVPESERDHRIAREAAEFALQVQSFQDSLKDTIRDSTGSSQPAVSSVDITNEDGGDSGIEYETDDMADDEDDDEEEYYEDDGNDEDTSEIPDRRDPRSPDDVVYQKAALLKAKLLQYFDGRSEDWKVTDLFSNATRMKQKMATVQEQAQTDLRDIQSQVSQSPEELEQLRGLLRSRELELAEVSKQLEEAKAMLCLARAKATAELVHVKELTIEQDVRLQAAEQALSNTKQVHLEWFGEASRVELAGSFNGWQQYILLEPDFTSEIPKPDGARGPMMWGTYLCLYPGVYEIKFVVDGNWQVDHRREVVSRHSNQNNLLRVE